MIAEDRRLVARVVVACCGFFGLSCGGAAEPPPSVTLDISLRELSYMPCNVDGDAQVVFLTNTGEGPLTWSALTEGPFLVDGPSTGSVPPGGSDAITYRSRIPSSTPMLGEVTGAVIVSTNDPSHPKARIPLHAIAHGAVLHVGTPIDIGEVPLGGFVDHDTTVENVGDAPVEVSLGAPDLPTFETKTATFTSQPGTTTTPARFRFTPVARGPAETNVPAVYRGPICGSPPSTWPLRAKGVDGISVYPGKLDFGLVACGTTAGSQKIWVTNPAGSKVHFTVTYADGSRFEPIPAFDIGPDASLIVSIVPKPIPNETATKPNGFGDTITFTSDLPGDYPHKVDLEQTAYGAILSMPQTISAGRVLIDAFPHSPVSSLITNSGNAAAQVSSNVFGWTNVASTTTVPTVGSVDPSPWNIGRLVTVPLTYSVNGPVCGLDSPVVTMTPYDLAIDLDTANGSGCVIGHTHQIYCGAPVAAPSISKVFPSLDWVQANVSFATRVYVDGSTMLCHDYGGGFSCEASTPFVVYKPQGAFGFDFSHGGKTRACALGSGSALQCTGTNDVYQFGNGGTSNTWQQWSPAMTGLTGVTSFAGGASAMFAVTGGLVYGAGSDDGNSLLRGGNTSFVAPTPVLLPGLSNVVRVTTTGTGGCALHQNGTATCWDQNGLHPVTGISDGVEIAGKYGATCVIRSTGGVRCSDGAISFPTTWDAPNLVGPVQKITPECALEANGAVTCWNAGYQAAGHLRGFEGP